MGILDTVSQMKSQGYNEDEIVSQLREQGISPKDINNALKQFEIKSAVSRMNQEESPYAPSPGGQAGQEGQGGDIYTPQREIPQQEAYSPYQQTQVQEYYPQSDFYGAGGGYAQQAFGTDTVIEISEQVFAERIKKIQKSVEELNEFKSIFQAKVDNAVERIKRIEQTMDKLQIAILEKIGSYGENLESIKKEMSMMQDSFGKMVGKAAEKTERKSRK